MAKIKTTTRPIRICAQGGRQFRKRSGTIEKRSSDDFKTEQNVVVNEYLESYMNNKSGGGRNQIRYKIFKNRPLTQTQKIERIILFLEHSPGINNRVPDIS